MTTVYAVHKTGPEWDRVLAMYWNQEDAECQAKLVELMLDKDNVVDSLSSIRIVQYEVKGCLPKNHQSKK